MQFVHIWSRKRPYALCKSCRGMLDLQLSYSNFWALQFKYLEKNLVKEGQVELVLTRRSRAPQCDVSAPHRARARRGTPGPGRRGIPATVGSQPSHRRPLTQCSVATRRTPTGRAKPPRTGRRSPLAKPRRPLPPATPDAAVPHAHAVVLPREPPCK
jgi:hypothetical protein